MRTLFVLACCLGLLVVPTQAQNRSVVAGLAVGLDIGE